MSDRTEPTPIHERLSADIKLMKKLAPRFFISCHRSSVSRIEFVFTADYFNFQTGCIHKFERRFSINWLSYRSAEIDNNLPNIESMIRYRCSKINEAADELIGIQELAR